MGLIETSNLVPSSPNSCRDSPSTVMANHLDVNDRRSSPSPTRRAPSPRGYRRSPSPSPAPPRFPIFVRLRRLRIPLVLATVVSMLLVLNFSRESRFMAFLPSRPRPSPDDPLPSIEQRLSTALSRVPHFPSDKIIWQSAKDPPGEDDRVWDAWISWTRLNPDWTRRLVTDDQMMHYVMQLAVAGVPEALSTYTAMPRFVMRLDFLRYILVYMYGGVWADIDTEAYKPVSDWYEACGGAGLITGIETDYEGYGHDGQWLNRSLQLAQYVFAAKRGHPLLHQIILDIVHESTVIDLADPWPWLPLVLTGPRRWSDNVLQYVSRAADHFSYRNLSRLEAPVVLDDVCILPLAGFGSGQREPNSPPTTDPGVLAHHFFTGSWVDPGASWDRRK